MPRPHLLPASLAAPDTLEVLHQDDSLLVVAKPSGLLSVPGRGQDKQDCLAARVAARVPDALVVHRLDMATSGLLVFARGLPMQRRLSAAFAERKVEKRYVAVVAGRPAAAQGEVALPLITDWPNRPRQKVDPIAGKPSLTRYRVLGPAAVPGWSLPVRPGGDPQDAEPGGIPMSRLALEPVTGRSHQLRVHLWAIGHPIVGDALYAPGPVRDLSPRLLLHAESLSFTHPATGERLQFCQAAPF